MLCYVRELFLTTFKHHISKLIFYFWKNNKLFFVYLFIVCDITSNAAWSQSGITIAGNPAGIAGSDLSSLSDPIGLYYDEANNYIVVTDNGNVRVMKFSLNNPPSAGTIVAGNNGNGCALNQFDNIISVAGDSYGQLYVTNTNCNLVVRYPPGSTSATFGTALGSVLQPEGLFVNQLTDDLYVASLAGNTVYKFASNSTVPVVAAGT
jgi:DNA-binding beta-propeller fold protein YncE